MCVCVYWYKSCYQVECAFPRAAMTRTATPGRSTGERRRWECARVYSVRPRRALQPLSGILRRFSSRTPAVPTSNSESLSSLSVSVYVQVYSVRRVSKSVLTPVILINLVCHLSDSDIKDERLKYRSANYTRFVDSFYNSYIFTLRAGIQYITLKLIDHISVSLVIHISLHLHVHKTRLL